MVDEPDKNSNFVSFRLKEPYLSELKKMAKSKRTTHSKLAKQILCEFIDSITKRKETNENDSNQLRITNNVMNLINYFMDKYGLRDYNVAINYLLLRGILLEVKITEVGSVNHSKVWDELVNLKKSIKDAYITKLATQRINEINEYNQQQMSRLSGYISSVKK